MLNKYTSVSYTHLDVYKRQDMTTAVPVTTSTVIRNEDLYFNVSHTSNIYTT